MANEPDPLQDAVDAASKQLGRAVGNLKRWSGSLQSSTPNMVGTRERGDAPPPPSKRRLVAKSTERTGGHPRPVVERREPAAPPMRRSVPPAVAPATQPIVQPVVQPERAPVGRSVLAPPPEQAPTPQPFTSEVAAPAVQVPDVEDYDDVVSEQIVVAAPATVEPDSPAPQPPAAPAPAPTLTTTPGRDLEHATDRRAEDLALVVSENGFALPPPPEPFEIPPPSSLLVDVPALPVVALPDDQ